MASERIEAPRSVLVVCTRRIGDVLLATPLLRSLRAAWPQARIDVLVFAGTEGVLQADAGIGAIITVPERPRLGEHLRLLARIWRRYDLALSLLTGDRPTLYAWAAGRRRGGMVDASGKAAWKSRLLQVRVPFDDIDTHTVRMNLGLAQALGIPARADVAMSWSRADESALAELVPAAVRTAGYAVLHPYPKFNYKMWHTQGWAALARWLETRGLRVLLSGGGAPDEVACCEDVRRAAGGGPINLAGMLSLGQLGALLSHARLYVGPDTVVTHMAAGLGVPTVALFGPSNPVKWGPWPKGWDAGRNPWQRVGSRTAGNVHLLQGQAHCVPCMQEGCERNVRSFSDCLQHLDARRVVAAADALLAADPRLRPPAEGRS